MGKTNSPVQGDNLTIPIPLVEDIYLPVTPLTVGTVFGLSLALSPSPLPLKSSGMKWSWHTRDEDTGLHSGSFPQSLTHSKHVFSSLGNLEISMLFVYNSYLHHLVAEFGVPININFLPHKFPFRKKRTSRERTCLKYNYMIVYYYI